jgi:hypothetical protein
VHTARGNPTPPQHNALNVKLVMGMNLEVKNRIALVHKAVDSRRKMDRVNPPPSREKIVRAEEDVCIHSRALYSKFVDTTLWRDGIDAEVATHVREALTAARDCIAMDEQCKHSVGTRLNNFEQFCAARTDLAVL